MGRLQVDLSLPLLRIRVQSESAHVQTPAEVGRMPSALAHKGAIVNAYVFSTYLCPSSAGWTCLQILSFPRWADEDYVVARIRFPECSPFNRRASVDSLYDLDGEYRQKKSRELRNPFAMDFPPMRLIFEGYLCGLHFSL